MTQPYDPAPWFAPPDDDLYDTESETTDSPEEAVEVMPEPAEFFSPLRSEADAAEAWRDEASEPAPSDEAGWSLEGVVEDAAAYEWEAAEEPAAAPEPAWEAAEEPVAPEPAWEASEEPVAALAPEPEWEAADSPAPEADDYVLPDAPVGDDEPAWAAPVAPVADDPPWAAFSEGAGAQEAIEPSVGDGDAGGRVFDDDAFDADASDAHDIHAHTPGERAFDIHAHTPDERVFDERDRDAYWYEEDASSPSPADSEDDDAWEADTAEPVATRPPAEDVALDTGSMAEAAVDARRAETRGARVASSPHVVRARVASTGARCLSWIVDGGLVVGAVLALLWSAGVAAGGAGGLATTLGDAALVLQALVLAALVGAVYTAVSVTLGGQTLGGRFAGVRILDGRGSPPDLLRASVRGLLAGAGVLAFGVGLAWVLVDERGQALHDRLTRTFAVEA